MNPVLQQLQAEATRRGMGQPPSNAGTQPNPSASRPATPTPAPTPVAGGGQPNMMQPQQPTMPTSGDPFGGASAMMNGSAPMKGGTFLEKSLVKRLNMYPPA